MTIDMIEINFQIFTSAVIIATLNESLINIYKFIYDDFSLLCKQRKNKKHQNNTKSNHNICKTWKRISTRILAIVLGISLSIFTKISIMELLHIPIIVFPSDSVNKAIEYIITGLIISRGSNMLYDLIKKIKYFDKTKEDNNNEAEGESDNGTKNDSLTVQNEE